MKSQESLRRALDLSLAIYRVTDRLPAGEVLITQLRGIANEIVRDLTGGDFSCARKKIDIILNYFKIAQGQSWVKNINWLILAGEYQLLIRDLLLEEITSKAGGPEEQNEAEEEVGIMSHNKERAKKAIKPISEKKAVLLSRQEKLLETVRNNSQIKMSGLVTLLENVTSERTIRNDLKELLKLKLIKKDGKNKSVKYSVV